MTPSTLSNGRYTLLEPLGQGGMATVWRASDGRLGVERAIKILAPSLAHRADLRDRFEREARAMARLNHPNTVIIHDVAEERGEDENRILYIVMELVTGGSLATLVDTHGPIETVRACRIVAQALRGLEAAHDAGIIHRDLKPGNILLAEDDRPKVSDFGIAFVAEEGRSLTRTGVVLGTYAYVAPEVRLDPRAVSIASDIYSMGATLFAIVTDREPFDLYVPQLHPSQFADIHHSIASVIHKATAWQPTQRYPTARDMREDLETAILDLLPTASALPFLADQGAPDPALAFPTGEGTHLPPLPLHPTEAWATPGRLPMVLTSELRTGNADIDSQHEQLFQWGYELLREFDYPGLDQDLINGLRFLGAYVVQHFANEEQIMAGLAYPGLETHRRAHDAARREARDLIALAETQGVSPHVRDRLRTLFSTIIANHVRTHDLTLSHWLAERPRVALAPLEPAIEEVDHPAWRRWLDRLKRRSPS